MPLPSNIIAITVAGQGVLTWAILLFVFLVVLALVHAVVDPALPRVTPGHRSAPDR